jgi:hypothetical protein
MKKTIWLNKQAIHRFVKNNFSVAMTVKGCTTPLKMLA